MSEKADFILADLKSRLGDKLWLTPKDLKPLLKKSEGAQAKMRARGYIPPPAQPLGKSAGMSIYDLTSWLAGEVEMTNGKSSAASSRSPTPAKPRRTNKVKTKGRYDHLLSQWQMNVSYQLEVLAVIEALPLTKESEEATSRFSWEQELTFSLADILGWRKQLDEQLDQIAQVEKKILLGELDGLEFLDKLWASI